MDIEKGLDYLSTVDDDMRRLITSFPKPQFNIVKNTFPSLVKYLIYQQLSSKAAFSIFKKYMSLFPGHTYQDPQKVLLESNKNLKQIGLSRQKVLYIQNVATAYVNGDIPDNLIDLSNNEINNILIKIKGVGRWTIDMFLMFTIQRPDVMPFSDLGIKKGFMNFYKLQTLPDDNFMKAKSQLWSPFRTLAAIYLWHLVDDGFEW